MATPSERQKNVLWHILGTLCVTDGGVGSIYERHRTAERTTHIFREHNKEADAWAEEGAKGLVEELVDTAQVVWPEIIRIGLCGFWDGSCDNGNCGAGIMIMACTKLVGWFTIYKNVSL